MSRVEELKKKAEASWEGCHGCNESDKDMWINGYIKGALANQIELPSDKEIERKSLEYSTDTESWDFQNGAIWMRDKIKGGQDNE